MLKTPAVLVLFAVFEVALAAAEEELVASQPDSYHSAN